MRSGDYNVIVRRANAFGIPNEFAFTGRIKYTKYPDKVIMELEIIYNIKVREKTVFLNALYKSHSEWVDNGRFIITYNPLPISETIVECGQ